MGERENGRGRASERKDVGQRGSREVTEGVKLKPRVFYVEFKSFFIELDTKSWGETIIITERSRSRNYKIGIGLGCAAWLTEQLNKFRGAGEQKVCKLFRGNNYNFWLENYKNENGAFLKLSQCERSGFVQTIILPKGQRGEGLQKLEDNLNTFMFGYNNKGSELDRGYAEKQNLNGQVLHDHSKDILVSLKNRVAVTEDNSQMCSSQLSEVCKDTCGCVVVCERQTVFQSWKCIETCLSRWLGREVDLFPYQNNRAFFVCKNCEDVEMIVKQGKIPLKGQSEWGNDESSFDEELEKEERDWHLNHVDGETVNARLDEENYGSDQTPNAFHNSDEETEPSDVDASSNEESKEDDPLEDDDFCLREFLSNLTLTKGNEILNERVNKSKKMELAEKIGKSRVGDESDCSSSNLPISQYKKKKQGIVKGGKYNSQKLPNMCQSVGKMGRFLAPMKLSLTSIKTERKPRRNSANSI
ncbi:hypothetical protein M0R45_015012 [Rubus argutus]|uniref:Uncharacterized protein n=1 Tax=Rubus argutus TaxID=59490 RepID=A0AAW1XN69_RUBAR